MSNVSDVPGIAEFYAGKNIFITGATGFVGKVIIEKLLRSCPDLNAVYILVRPKKSKGFEQRVQDLIKSKLFDKVKEEQPGFQRKIVPIDGDITSPHLGIHQDNLELLKDTINVVIHSAATVKFDEELRLSLEMNVLATRKMIHMARQLKNLEAFVHVSTAYANCDLPLIEETVYEPTVEPQNLIDTLSLMDDETIAQMTPKLIGDKPNTYTFTKHLAEYLLLKEGQGLPLAIIRPSIVCAAWKEPLAGWIDSLNGPTGLGIAVGKGFIRSMNANVQALADIVPVDFCANMTIAVGWYTAVKKPSSCLIFNSITGNLNPCTWGELAQEMVASWNTTPVDSCLGIPDLALSGSSLHNVNSFLKHMVPSFVIDVGYRVVGKKPRMVKLCKRLEKAINSFSFFLCNSWKWTYNNTDMLWNQISPEDKKCFDFDPRGIHWPTYMKNYCLGSKTFILKEDLSHVSAARRRLRKFRNIYYCFNTVMILAVCQAAISASSYIVNHVSN